MQPFALAFSASVEFAPILAEKIAGTRESPIIYLQF